MAQLPPKSVAILRSAPMRTMTNDVEYLYRQDSDFYYLTGIEQEDVTAVLRPDAADGKKYVLFLQPRDLRREAWAGARVGPDEAVAAYGADAAFPLARLRLQDVRVRPEHLHARAATSPTRPRSTWPTATTRNGSRSSARASTRSAPRRGGPSTLVDARGHHPRDAPDQGRGGPPVPAPRRRDVGAGPHARDAGRGARQVRVRGPAGARRLLLRQRRAAHGVPLDLRLGPELLHPPLRPEQPADEGRRAAARTIPAPSTGSTPRTSRGPIPSTATSRPSSARSTTSCSPRRRRRWRSSSPASAHDEIEKAAALTCAQGLVKLGLLTGDPAELVKSFGHRRFTLHGVSHWVGFDVHDPSPYGRAGGADPAARAGHGLHDRAGHLHPGEHRRAWIPKWWNIGVRIEDTILVTKDGADCLSCGAPREVADVEKTVQSGRKK